MDQRNSKAWKPLRVFPWHPVQTLTMGLVLTQPVSPTPWTRPQRSHSQNFQLQSDNQKRIWVLKWPKDIKVMIKDSYFRLIQNSRFFLGSWKSTWKILSLGPLFGFSGFLGDFLEFSATSLRGHIWKLTLVRPDKFITYQAYLIRLQHHSRQRADYRANQGQKSTSVRIDQLLMEYTVTGKGARDAPFSVKCKKNNSLKILSHSKTDGKVFLVVGILSFKWSMYVFDMGP